MSQNLVADVFGSDLESDGEALPPTSRAASSPAAASSAASPGRARAPIAFSDSESGGEDAAPSPAPRRRRASVDHSSGDDSPRDAKRRRRSSGVRRRRVHKLEPEEALVNEDDDRHRRRADSEEREERRRLARDERDRDDGHDGDVEREEDELEETKPEKPKNAFEEALDYNKSLRRPRRVEIDPAKVEAECVTFLERMMSARDDDMKAYKAGRPALNKLRMLREVELMVMKVSHREQLMDNMLLAIIKAWLDPMPDGALPNVQIRTSLLEILSDIPVDADWVERLESSQGLGRVIHFLSVNEDYAPNKRIAEKLLSKWSRPVYQSNANFQDLLQEFEKPEEGHRAPKDGIASERRAALETVRHFKTTQEKIKSFKSKTGKGNDEQILASVPRPTPFLYHAMAAENTGGLDEKTIRELRAAKARKQKVNKTLSTLRKTNKNQSARAAKPSVNGRR